MWYYQVGGKALGPVPWSEIETLLEDTYDAEDLPVARAGDDGWRPASEVIAGFEEDEAEDEAADKIEKAEPLTPVHGLSAWVSQAWQIIADNPQAFIVSNVLLIALSAVSLLLCFPALHTGLYCMALKRFEGEKSEARGVVEGFEYFGRALGLYLTIFLIGLPFGVVALLALVAGMIAVGAQADAGLLGTVSSWLFWLAASAGMALPGAAAFFAVPLMVDRDMGPLEAVRASWEVTRRDYLSFLGMTLVLSLLSALLCWLGLIITLPILPAGQVCAYKHYFDGEQPVREGEAP